MATSSGTISSGSSLNQNPGGTEQQAMIDQKKRKRMISNKESARRSRMRKQKHLDDLMAQVGQLRKENREIVNGINVTTQLYVSVEAENCVLRAQVCELDKRLQALNDIIGFLSSDFLTSEPADCFFDSSVNLGYLNLPITAASADILQY